MYAYVDYNGKNVGRYNWKKNDLNLQVRQSWNPDSEMVLSLTFPPTDPAEMNKLKQELAMAHANYKSQLLEIQNMKDQNKALNDLKLQTEKTKRETEAKYKKQEEAAKKETDKKLADLKVRMTVDLNYFSVFESF